MSANSFTLPPVLDRQARKIARRDGVPMERVVATAVAAFVSADKAFHAPRRMNKETAKRRLLELLDKAPDVPPIPGDELPPDLAAKFQRFRSRRTITTRNGAK